MKKQLLTSMVSAAMVVGSMAAPSVFAEDSPHTFSGNVAITTDYVFRGYTQNNEDPSIQGGFDYEHESGFYAGIWGAAVDFNDANVELDYYVGYGSEFGNGLGWDVGVLYYDYPSSFGGVETTEVHVGLSYDFGPAAVNGTWYHSSDYFAADEADVWELGVDVPLPYEMTFSGVIRTTDYDDSPAKGGGDDYDDYSLGLSKEFGGFGFDLSYYDTNGVSGSCKDVCDDRVVFTVSKSL